MTLLGKLALVNDTILTIGDRGKGMISQDYKKHPSDVNRIKNR